MHLFRTLLISSTLLTASLSLHAQSLGPSAVNASGNSVTSGGITHEYAIGGSVAGNTYISSSLVVTPGVLQPASSTSVVTHTIAPTDLQIYPSPMQAALYLQPAFTGGGKLQYSLYDATGKLIDDKTASLINGNERQMLQVATLAAGQYLLQVQWTQANKTYSSSYKVQKLQ